MAFWSITPMSIFASKKIPRSNACVILHNMIIDDERDLNLELFYDNIDSRVKPTRNSDEINAFLKTYP